MRRDTLSPVSLEFTGERVVPDAADSAQRSLLVIHQAIYTYIAHHCWGKTVLDIGCGTGHGTHYLHQSGAARVWGVDIATEAVLFATRRYPLLQSSLLACDALNLPFAPGRFDVVVAIEVLEHVVSDGAFLQTVRQVLQPQGTCIISTPNRLVHSPTSVTPLNPFHFREYTADELQSLLQQVFRHVTILAIMIRQREFLIRYHHSQGLQPTLPVPLSNIERFLAWHMPPWNRLVVQNQHVQFTPEILPMCWGLLAICQEPY